MAQPESIVQPTVSRDEMLARLHDPEWTIVDVLSRDAYDEGHLPGAVSLPLADIPARARTVLPDQRREVAVYCAGHG